ncbi:MAG: N-acetylmuramoyl-L-alanine amidase [Bacteroidota bacterium]
MIDTIKTLISQNKVEQTLKRASTDKSSIISLQTALYELGYGEELNWDKFKADGDYGGSTANAVKAFAANNEMGTLSGNEVSKTMAEKIVEKYDTISDLRALKKAVDAKLLAELKKSNSKNPLAASLQHLLNAASGASLKVDGFFGGGTVTAVKNFASKVGINTNGDAIDASLADKLIDKFIPGLGKGWFNAKRNSGVGKYYDLFPESNKGKFSKVEKLRNKSGLELYKDLAKMKAGESSSVDKILPLKDRNGNKIKDQVYRPYRYEFKEAVHKIPGEELEMDYVEVTKFRDGKSDPVSSFCFQETSPKTQIVLHHTIGLAAGDLRTLSKEDYHVSTAYVLGRDGTIYQMFSPHQWSYHLGKNEVVGNKTGSKRAVGIEICNYGWLKEGTGKNAGKLLTLYNQVYCSKEDTDAYVELPQPYRFHKYYATFTEEQYESVIVMLRYLTKEFKVPKTFPGLDLAKHDAGAWDQIPLYNQFANDAKAQEAGICSHVNYRLAISSNAGKWDLGPAFEWKKVMDGLQAPTFERKQTLLGRAIGGLFGGPEIRTQDEVIASRSAFDYGNEDPDQYGPDGPEVHI